MSPPPRPDPLRPQGPRESSIGRDAALQVLCLIVATAWAGPGIAQDFRQVAPFVPAGHAPPPITPPAPVTPEGGDPAQVIMPRLIGLRFVDGPGKVLRDGAGGSGVILDGLPLLEGARPELQGFLGRPLTFGDLNAIARAVTLWYRAQGHPFMDVAFPEQDISTGVVQGVVTEFRVGAIEVTGNRWFSSEAIRGGLGLAPGDPIDAGRLETDLARLNQNPFREVSLVMAPGSAAGTTDLDLETRDRFPLRLYAGYDNSGNVATGRDRWNLGFNSGNALWLDGVLSYRFTSSDDFWHHRQPLPEHSGDPSFLAHAVDWTVPLPWRDRVEVFGDWVQQVPQLGPALGQVAHGGQASLRYVIGLPRLPWLAQELELGYDFKTTDSALAFGGVTVLTSLSEVDQFPLTYGATLTDPYGQTMIRNSLVLSPGNMTAHNNDASFQPGATSSGVPFAKARYVYDRISLTRVTALPAGMSWLMRVTTQFTSSNLLQSEQLPAGGIDSVRGYDEYAASGSEGVLLTQELRSPPFSVAQLLTGRSIKDQVQLDAFWDYADVYDKQRIPGNPSSVQLASVGLGVRCVIDRHFDLRFDYGWQLRNAPGATEHGQFGHLSFTVAY